MEYKNNMWGDFMLECEINNLRKELNDMISRGASFQEVYTVSIILDKLIVAFYTQTVLKK